MQIELSFLGASENVTGSRFLVEVDGTKVLIDCGLYQERELRDRNWDKFPVEPSEIDAVLLTHAHLDHCGLLPKLVREGFTGSIYCTEPTSEITRIVLLDAGSLQEEDAAYKRKRHKREGREVEHPVEPLYTVEDAQKVAPFFRPVKYQKTVDIADGITAEFYEAGHILGAAFIRLTITIDGQTRSIVFSGDLGRKDRPLLRDPHQIVNTDYIVCESTYGDRLHEPYPEKINNLATAINRTVQAGGNIIVPSFAIERAQEILYHLNELIIEKKIPKIMTFLDSPMAISVTKVFEKYPEIMDTRTNEIINTNGSPFDFPGLQMTRSTKESKMINTIKGTVMIIAGSGMCTGGRVKHHLLANIERPESTILFVGYQAFGTLGREILKGPAEVRILGQMCKVKASIERIHGFSGHADRDELIDWLSGIEKQPKKVFIVHGETETASSFKEFLADKKGWDVSVPKYKQKIILD
jgi:metallo-beta-lactamase family protein